MLASFLGRPVISIMYLSEGVFGSVFFILLYLGDFSHSFCAQHLSFLLYAHFSANTLCGSVFLRYFSRSHLSLLPSIIDFFASSSTCSFPSTPLWPGIHLNSMWMPQCFCFSAAMCSCSVSSM
jgi:hypothetical protein